MPLLTLDPSQAQALNATVQENNLDPPSSPTEPTVAPNPEPATPPGPPRTLGKTQVFTPFVVKNPENKGDASLVDAVNKHLAEGGKIGDLDSDILTGLHQATQGGDGSLTNRDVVGDSEQFYQLKFKNGKYEPGIIDTLVGLHNDPLTNYPKLAEGFIQNAIDFVRTIGVGSYKIATTPAPAQPATISTGWEAIKQFYKSLNPLMEVPGMGAVGAGIGMGLQMVRGPALATIAGQSETATKIAESATAVSKVLGVPETGPLSDIAQDLSLRLNKMFAGDEHSREQIDRAQSEIIRNRLLRDQNSQDAINAAKYKTADNLASLGLNDWANATQKAVVTPEMQAVAQMVLDPQTWIEFGMGKSAGTVKTGVRMDRLETAAANLAKTSEIADNLAVQREAFKGVIRAPNATQEERIAAQRTLGAMTPLDRDAQTAVARATQEHQAAVDITNQEMTDAAQPSIGRYTVGKLTQGTGALAEMAGKLSDFVATLPDKVIGGIAPDMDPVAKGILAQSIRHVTGSVLHGGPLTGGLPAMLTPIAAKSLQKYGRDLSMIGEQFALGQQTLPFWKAIKENTTGMTKWAASRLDNQLVYSIPDTARGARNAALMGGAIGGVQSGGTTQGVLGGMASGGVIGTAGGGLGQLKKFNSPGELHAAAIGDRARFVRTLNDTNSKFFNALDPGSQLGISVYARAHPDTVIDFFSGGKGDVNGDHQVAGGKSLIRINVDGNNPFQAVLAHEIGHHVAAHGLGDEVHAQMLGDAATGRPGIFTKYGLDGKPLVDIPDANGIVRYLPNDEFERYKADYNSRLPDGHPKAGNYDIAQEMFADLYASKFAAPAEVQKLVRGYVPPGIIGDNAIANWLTKVNVGADPITGRSVITDAQAKTKGLNDILINFYRQKDYKRNPVSDDTGHVKVPVTSARKGTDEFGRLSQTFDATSELRRNPDGTLWTDSAGRPSLVSPKEMDSIHGQMTDDIISAIKANPQYEAMPGDYVKMVTDRRGRQYYRGQTLQPEAIDALASSNKYNAVQVLNLRKIDGVMTRNDGTMVTSVYNTAGKRGRYATLPAQERATVPLYFEIDPKTRQTNILSYDPEQMSVNITKVLRRGKAKELWDGNIQSATDDVKTYLDNLANGRPGETGIGLEKKAVINNLFGLASDANPLINDVTRKSPSVFKTFRLDRINRLNELSATMPLGRETYEQVRAHAQPRESEGGTTRAQPRAREDDGTAIPVTYRTTSSGKTKPVAIPSNVAYSPLVGNKAPPEKMAKDAPNQFKHLDYLSQTDGQKLTHLDQQSAVTTYADKLVEEYSRWTKNSDVMGAKTWYRDVRKYLTKAVGSDAELFAQLLSATSPGQGVVQNWKDAQTAYERYKAGHYDDAIAEFGRTGKITDEMKPRTEAGAKFGKNSDAVLKVLAGTWEDTVRGPKTPNFMDNLFGRGTRATIDLWADRTMRRMGHEGVPGAAEQWRIQPESKTGVSNLDFGLAQEAFGQAAKRLGMDAHELQAVLWYGEKMHWAQKGYAKGGAQSALASYIPQLKAYAAEKAAARAATP